MTVYNNIYTNRKVGINKCQIYSNVKFCWYKEFIAKEFNRHIDKRQYMEIAISMQENASVNV